MNIPYGDIVCLIPTWITARRALGAYRNFHQYYPEIPVYFVDDTYEEGDVKQLNDWRSIYHDISMNPEVIFDPDYTKLIGLPNSCYVQGPHMGYEAEGHGGALTNAMKFVHAKWVIQMSSDVRLVASGFLEEAFKDVDDTYCAIGKDRMLGDNGEFFNLSTSLFIFRGDLYRKYNLDMDAHFEKHQCVGGEYFNTLKDKGYKVKIEDYIPSYITHLRYNTPERQKEWSIYY